MEKRKILLLSVVVATVMLSTFSFYFYQIIYEANFLVERESKYLFIPTAASFEDVQRIIYDEKFVNDPISFGMLSKFMKYNKLVKPGKYFIEKNSSNLEVIRKLRLGDQAPVRITFNNARMLPDVAEKISVNLQLDGESFMEMINSPGISEKYGFDQETFRCMFIPNTYEVFWTISREDLADRLYREYLRFWNEERLDKAKKLGMDPIQVTILASIVQAEISHNVEGPIVAGLYLNRLKREIPLQADPTLVYAVGDFTIKRVLNIHKEIDSPYNTYKFAGLPPGPINFPSITSIDAVLDPAEHSYIYMCAKEDFSGYHNFSSSLRQHSINARKYQQALNKAKLFR